MGKPESTDDKKDKEHDCVASNVDRCTAEARKQQPAKHDTHDVACRKGDVDVERLHFGEPCILEEDNTVAKDSVTTQDLCGPDDTVLVCSVRDRRELQ